MGSTLFIVIMIILCAYIIWDKIEKLNKLYKNSFVLIIGWFPDISSYLT